MAEPSEKRAAAPNEKLAAVMREANVSHKALARAVRDVAAAHGETGASYDHSYVTRWLSGTSPRGRTPHFIAEALSRKLGRRLTLEDVGLAGAGVDAPGLGLGLDFADQPAEAVRTVSALLRADLGEAGVLTTAGADAAAWHETSLRWLVAPPDDVPIGRGGRSVGLGDVQRIRSTTDMFATLDGKFGGGHARRALIQYLHSDVRPMLDGRYTDAVAEQLYGAIAEALRLAGWMSYDSGFHGLAQRYYIQGLRMAQTADDKLIGSSILSAMSHQANFLGRYREAATLARAASSGPAAGLTPATAAQYRSMEARALARLGDAKGCDAALAEAESRLSARTPDSDPEFIAYFNEVELADEVGHCFRDLGRSAEVMERGACSLFNDGLNVRSDFFATMVLADAYISQGEVEQACATATQALQLGETLQSARCVQYLREFRARADKVQTAGAYRDFAEQARSYRLWRQLG